MRNMMIAELYMLFSVNYKRSARCMVENDSPCCMEAASSSPGGRIIFGKAGTGEPPSRAFPTNKRTCHIFTYGVSNSTVVFSKFMQMRAVWNVGGNSPAPEPAGEESGRCAPLGGVDGAAPAPPPLAIACAHTSKFNNARCALFGLTENTAYT